MKVLVLSATTKLRRTRDLWSELGKFAEVELEVLGEGRFVNLRHFAETVDGRAYDRIIMDQNLRRTGRDYRWLRKVPNAVIYDFDFYHNYLPKSRFRGKGESILKSLPEHRLITSSASIKNDLSAKGFDAAYSPKAYSRRVVHDLKVQRDIELGFIGRTKHSVYAPRRLMLRKLQQEVGLESFFAGEGEEYNRLLHRIRIFVCPDLHFSEFMIKNYEAMAAGCILVTARQSEEELKFLGFADMENVVLFGSYAELLARLKQLRDDPGLSARIAQAGQAIAQSRHRWEDRAERFYQILQPPLRRPPALTWKDRWNLVSLRLSPSKL